MKMPLSPQALYLGPQARALTISAASVANLPPALAAKHYIRVGTSGSSANEPGAPVMDFARAQQRTDNTKARRASGVFIRGKNIHIRSRGSFFRERKDPHMLRERLNGAARARRVIHDLARAAKEL